MTTPLTNKGKMIEVAIDLFSAKGFKGTSVRDIARKMGGTSISNIYHYFGNKEGLWLAILEQSGRRILENIQKVAELEMEPLARFRLLLETHISQSKHHTKESNIFFLSEEDLTPAGNEINRQIQRQFLDIYIKQLRTLEAMGYVKCRSTTVMAFNILGVINWQLRWFRLNGVLSLEEISEEIVSFIMHGILGPLRK